MNTNGHEFRQDEMKTVLIDGWMGNHRRLERMRGNLVATSVSSWMVESPRTHVRGYMETSIWRYDSSGRTSLEILGGQLGEYLRNLDEPFCAVGYSMGGLVLREAMRQAPELPLRRAAFLHTPHQGTWAGYTLNLPAVCQMRPGSSFLRRLNETEWQVPTFNVWCPGDLVVVPGWNARWRKATNEERCDVPGHIWPLVSRRMHERIRAFLEPIRINRVTRAGGQKAVRRGARREQV
jgi:pimeloyl-ACP methyl ester carboxylesterase